MPLIRVMGKGRRERLLAFSPAVQREMLRYLRIRESLFGVCTGVSTDNRGI